MNRASHHTPLQRLTTTGTEIQAEHVVNESAVVLQALNDLNEYSSFATLLATPIDLVELLAGHLISEGYATSIQREFINLNVQDGFTVSYRGQLLHNVQHRIVNFMRSLQPSRTSCGHGCGKSSDFDVRECSIGVYSQGLNFTLIFHAAIPINRRVSWFWTHHGGCQTCLCFRRYWAS